MKIKWYYIITTSGDASEWTLCVDEQSWAYTRSGHIAYYPTMGCSYHETHTDWVLLGEGWDGV